MPDESPFKHAYDPMGPRSHNVVKCPACGEQDFDARSNAYGVHRKCRKCGNEWSGGGVGSYPDGSPRISDNAPIEDDVEPPINNDVPAYRDPRRNYGGDE